MPDYTLADLILRSGQQRAAGLASLGDIAAAGAQARGQVWGQTLGSIGQLVAGIPQEIRQRKQQAQEDQNSAITLKANQLKLKQAQDAATDQEDMARALKGNTRQSVMTRLQAQGRMDLAPQIIKQFDDADKAAADALDAKTKAQNAELDYFGSLGAGVRQFGYDPTAASIALDHADEQGHDTSQIRALLAQDPSKLPAIVDQIIAASPKQRELDTSAQNAKSSALTAQTGADRFAVERPGIAATSALNAQRAIFAQGHGGLTPSEQADADARAATLQQQQTSQAQTASYQNRMAAIAEQNARLAAQKQDRETRTAAGGFDPETDTRTSVSGQRYVDLGDFETPTARQQARDAAKAAGITVVDKTTGDSLRAADTARLNMQAMWAQIQSKLPKDAGGRIVAGPTNKLSQWFQTDDDLAAFNSWRAGAIQAVQALVEKGMGFRMNQAEINMIMQNDMPQITDTYATAERRINNVLKLLDDKEKVALTRDRSTIPNGANGNGANQGGVSVTGKDGQSYTFPTQQQADAFKRAGG